MIKKILLLASFLAISISYSQTIDSTAQKLKKYKAEWSLYDSLPDAARKPDSFEPRLPNGGIKVRGNMTFVANNILNVRQWVNPPNWVLTTNASYNENEDNNELYLYYIDTDGFVDDNNDGYDDTFSSSTATLNLPNCSRVVYAGLYWAAVYTDGLEDYRNIKFKLPSSDYIDISATNNDREILSNTGESYTCFKDITALVQAEPNPNGVYTGANILATEGRAGGVGSAAGWVMVIVYENDTETAKNISIFDGYANVRGTSSSVDLTYTGFTTIPTGPVKVEQIIGALEGDGRRSGDTYQVKNKFGNYQRMSNALNPIDNFFNGKISMYGAYYAGSLAARNPASENTIGFDVDQFVLNNTGNSIIDNNQTTADVRFTTRGDYYFPFLSAMSVEIIEPQIKLVKTITDASGNDISGTPVILGSELFYDLTFQSVGTDNAINTEIIDDLPKNVDFLAADLILPDPSITYTYDPPVAGNGFRGRLTFSIPDDLVEIGDPTYSIKIKIKVVDDCSQLRDVCSNQIENIAFANYTRDLSFLQPTDAGYTPDYNRIENTPSFAGVDVCNLGQVGTSNFLIDISGCTFERTETICGGDVLLSAGTGFASYSWENTNNPGVEIASTQTYTATQTGTYIVYKVAPVGCIDSQETIIVENYNTASNPLLPFVDQTVTTCPSNMFELSEIYLCGVGNSRDINLPFDATSLTTVEWFKLNEASCVAETNTACANVNTTCTWDSLGSSFSENFANEGKYKLEVLYDGQCPTTYYFNVFESTLTPDIVKENIICGTDGSITVNNIPVGYQYSLSGVAATATAGYFEDFKNDNFFNNLSSPGDYVLTIRSSSATAASCSYTFPAINIQEENLTVAVPSEINMACANGTAQINVQADGAIGDYTYTVVNNTTGATIATEGPTPNKNFIFDVTTGGLYNVTVTTAKCSVTETTRVIEPDAVTVTALATKNITCKDGASAGVITLTGSGGTLDTVAGETYTYAVWSKDATDLYADVTSIPSSAYSTSNPLFTTNNTYSVPLGDEGEYVFIIFDSNNCYDFSSPVTITVENELVFTHIETPVTCNGNNDGIINVQVVDDLGYTLEYSINNTDWFPSGVFNSLSVATYTVYIKATKNTDECIYEVLDLEITTPLALSGGVAAPTSLLCGSPGSISFSGVAGGTPGYTYYYKLSTDTSYISVSGTSVSNLLAGDYDTRVIDANNCVLDLNTVTIDDVPTTPLLASSVDYNCDGTGNITITPLDVSYTYALDGGSPQTGNNVFNNVAVGPHTITVGYGSNCTVPINVTVLSDQQFTAIVTNQTNPVCLGESNGEISVTASFPSVPPTTFEYSIDNGITWTASGANPFTITGFSAGVHTLQVRPLGQTTGCNVTLNPVTLTNPTAVLVTPLTAVTKEITCNPATGATITPYGSGGSGAPYTFELFNNAGISQGAVFTNLIAGDYTIVATDSSGCKSVPYPITVNPKDDLDFTLTPEVCYSGTNDGTVTVNIITGNGNYIYSKDGGTTTQTSNIFTGLSDGVYSITVLDEFGCEETKSTTILPLLTATVTVTNETCNPGVLSIVSTGGDSNYMYAIVPTGATPTSSDFTATYLSDITAGTWDIYVRDQGGNTGFCQFITTRVVTRVADPTITTSVIEPNCSTDTGTINIVVSAGVAPYTVTVKGTGAPVTQGPSNLLNYSFTGLLADTYQVTVIDGNNCPLVTPGSETITTPLALSNGTAVSTALVCGVSGGSIDFSGVTGGTLGYTYYYKLTSDSLYTSVSGTSVSNLAPGDYDTRVIDANNCVLDLNTVTIDDVPTTPLLASSVDYNCDGTGNITITPLDVSYTYALDGGSPQTGNNVFNNVAVGPHTITVGYGSNCTVPINVTVLSDQQFTAIVTNQTNPVCLGESNGEISVTASFPSVPPTTFEYSIDNGITWTASGANPFTITGFSAGVHTLQVRPLGQTTGCNVTLNPVTLTNPTAVLVTPLTAVTKEITCNPATGATITPYGSGGSGAPYTFELFNNAGISQGAVFTNLIAGDYTIVATDSSGCKSVPYPITVNPKDNITFDAVALCYDGTNGTIEVTNITGNGNYQYTVNSGGLTNVATATSTEFTVTGLSSGNHIIRVQDDRGCFLEKTITINPALLATATPTNLSCMPAGTPTGQILVNPIDGSGTGYEFSVVTDGGAVGTYSSINPITGLLAGTYDVYVKDDVNCTYKIENVVINTVTPVAITLTANEPTCNGDPGSIDAVITANTGQAPYTITIANTSGIITTQTKTNFTGTNFSFDSLVAETYTITITDDLGCSDIKTLTLTDLPSLVIEIEDVLPLNCAVDPLNTGFNFININPVDFLPNILQYSIDNGTTWVDFTTTNGQVRNLNSGDIVTPALRTINSGGIEFCKVFYGNYEISYNLEGLIVNPVANPSDCSTGFSVTVEASGGNSPFEFAIGSPTGWELADTTSPTTLQPDQTRTKTYTGLIPGLSYDFFVRDAANCIKKNSEDVYQDFTPTVLITPTVNNDVCFGETNGQITFDIQNTTGDLVLPYDWVIYKRTSPATTGPITDTVIESSPASGENNLSITSTVGLSAGNYYILLSNKTASPVCKFGSLDVEIKQGTEITGQVTKVNDITCSVNGLVRIENVVGGFGDYTYTYTVTNATGILTGNTIAIDANTVTGTPIVVEVFAEDKNGCGPVSIGTETLNLSSSPTIVTAVPLSCDTNKTITITASNGTPPYRYSIDNGVTFSAPTLDTIYTVSALSPGSYDVVISDVNGCTDSQLAVVIQTNLDFNLGLKQNASCIPGNDAEVNISITSGTGGNYNYSFDTGSTGTIITPSTSIDVSLLAPGVHNITVTDVNSGCSITKTITVENPIKPSFTYNKINSVCAADNSGTIILTAIDNGVLPLTYTITPLPTNAEFSYNGTDAFIGLPPGTYAIEAQEASGCSTIISDIIIEELAPIVLPLPTVTEFGCTTGNLTNNASVILDNTLVTGGSGNYTKALFTYTPVTGVVEIQDSASFAFTTNNTSGGTIAITVYDDQGCSATSTATITAFDELTNANITLDTEISCTAGEDITVTFDSVSGITADIRIEGINGNSYAFVVQNGTLGDFDNLPAGDYQITITHPTTGCELVEFYTVSEAPVFDLIITDIVNAICKGDSGSAVLDISSASPSYTLGYTYTVYNASGIATTITGTGIGGTATPIAGLLAGDYYITIDMGTNSPFCTAQSSNFTIAEPVDALSVNGVLAPVVSCANGLDATITANATGGWNNYEYQLENDLGVIITGYAYSTNNIFTGLPSGNYVVRLRDGSGCIVTDTVMVTNPLPVSFNLTENDNACDISVGGSITVTATGGTGTYTYSLSNGSGLVATQVLNATSYTFANLLADTYTVNVADSNGCDPGVPLSVTINPDVNFSLVETKKVDCSALPNGEVTVTLESWVNGTANYTYSVVGSVEAGSILGGNVTTNPFTISIPNTNTTPQTYTVTITDNDALPSACSVSKEIIIQPRVEPNFTALAIVDNICFGSTTGVIKVTPTANGISPLTYVINNVANTYTATLVGTEFTNLPADDYVVTATGINGCTTDVSVSIKQLNLIVLPLPTVTEFGCSKGNLANSASVRIDNSLITGGSGNYTQALFTYTPVIGVVETQDSSNFIFTTDNISGGTVAITVYDDQGCSATSTATITTFDELTNSNITLDTEISCTAGEDITVTFDSVSGIALDITIQGINGNSYALVTQNGTAGDFDNLPAGDYQITITHPTTGCELVDFYTVSEAPVFDLIITDIENVSCKGDNNGSAVLDISSASPSYTLGYTYTVYNASGIATTITGTGIGGTATPIAGLLAGDYYITIDMGTNSPFCTAQSSNFTIAEPVDALTLNNELTYVSCSSIDSGQIILSATGGWGNYEYQLENDLGVIITGYAYSTNNIFTGLPSGNYVAIVKDDSNCTDSFSFTLNPTIPLLATVNKIENQCEGEFNASIEITNVTGGQTQDTSTKDYSYTLIYSNGLQVEQSSNVFENLSAGTNYQVIVRDNKYNCEYIENISIVDPIKVEAIANITTDITCVNNTATVEVSGTGGTGLYQFSSDGVAFTSIATTSTVFTGIKAGQQTFYVRDANNCVDTILVSINAYEPLIATLIIDSGFVTCNGDDNGALSATVSGGFGNYEYQLLDGANIPVTGFGWQASNMFNNLSIGTYKINVRSTNAVNVVCEVITEPHTIAQPPLLELTETHTDTNCFGGTDGTITITAIGGNGNDIPENYEYNISSQPTNKFVKTNVFENLSAGSYTVTVKDKVGCIETIDVEVQQPNALDITLINVVEQTCINDKAPSITVDVQGGIQPYFISINNVELSTSYFQNQITINDVQGIEAGESYLISVRDSGAGCSPKALQPISLIPPVDLQLTVDFEYTCEVGNIIKAIVDDAYKNAVSYTLYNGVGVAVTTNTTGEFIDVSAGNGYTVTVTHTATSCSENSNANPIDILDIKELSMTIDDSQRNKIIVNADFGLPPYEYSIDGNNFDVDNELIILQTKDYRVTVRDARGCTVTLIVRGDYVTIKIPNLFTPDGDGINDFWYPINVENYHNIKVYIYDRYARKIQNYQGLIQGWDGTYDGRPLPAGDYWYTIYYNELSGEEKKIMGHFTLYR
ncbi:T9SS type B sorting domain-containing protein [Tenacibaculum aestuariivivum]|uniref:T9SS type B sorting domain-containing protein n=1 Tax=Tenacibaculum aestuariivivum TaxID=2006131 RepID=UPI003AB7A28D